MKKSICITLLLLVVFLFVQFIPPGTAMAQDKIKLAVENLTTNVIDKELLLSLTEHLKNYIIRSGRFDLFAKRDIKTVEVDLLLTGSVVQIGKKYMINLRLMDAKLGKTLNSVRDSRTEDDLLSGIEAAASKLLVVTEIEAEEMEEPRKMPVMEGFGFLHVRSDPPGAIFILNGQQVGQTPRTLEMLKAGRYTVELRKEGFFDFRKEVVVRSGSVINVQADLKTIYGSIYVASLPYRADIFINGKFYGETPLTIEKLEWGDYDLSIRLEGYEDYNTTVEVHAGRRAELFGTLSETMEHREYRLAKIERRKKKMWAWGSLIAGGFFALKALSDYSASDDAYSEADSAYERYRQADNSDDAAEFRRQTEDKTAEGDSKASSGDTSAMISAGILGLSLYHFFTMPEKPVYTKSTVFVPQVSDNGILFTWQKRY